MRVKIKGIDLVISYSFVIFVALCLLTGASNCFWLILFASLHELGHLLSILILGGRVDTVTLSFVGIGIKYKTDFSYTRELIVLLSGVAVNSLFCIMGVEASVNGSLLLVNILPIYPLDGGRILKLLLNQMFSLNFSDRMYVFVSVATIISIFAYAVCIKNISLIIITIYVVVYSFCNSYD